MNYCDPYTRDELYYSTELVELDSVTTYFAGALCDGEVLSDLEPANACVRVIMKTHDGYYIDHLRVTADVNEYWDSVMKTRDLYGAEIILSGGNDYAAASRTLVQQIKDLVECRVAKIIGEDLLGDVERKAYVYNSHVVITKEDFSNKFTLEPSVFYFSSES